MRILFLVPALVGLAFAADAVPSGPPIGEELPGTFEPLDVTGPNAGEKSCIFCEYESRPVVLVFAREVNDPVRRLLKRLDTITERNQPSKLGSCIVFLSADANLARQLKQTAEQDKIQHSVLRIYKPEGPKDYNLSRDAEITVIHFVDRVVKAKHVFKRGELKDSSIDTIIADVAKVLPAK